MTYSLQSWLEFILAPVCDNLNFVVDLFHLKFELLVLLKLAL
jgi:hypothetical protein